MNQEHETKELSMEEAEKVNAGRKISVMNARILSPLRKLFNKLFGSGESDNKE